MNAQISIGIRLAMSADTQISSRWLVLWLQGSCIVSLKICNACLFFILHFSFNFRYEFPFVTVWSRNSSIYFYYQWRTWSSSRYGLMVEYHDLIVSLLKIHNVFTVTSRCNPHSDYETMAFCPRWIYIIGPRTLSGPRPRSRGQGCRVRRPLVWLDGLPASVSAVQRAM